MPTGLSRIKWNVLMGVSVIITTAAAFGPYGAWGKKLNGIYIGRWFVIAFIILAIGGQIYMHFKHKRNANFVNSADEEPATD